MSITLHPVKHKKTGKLYMFLDNNIIDCTKGANDKHMVLYANLSGTLFIREEQEFFEKFEILNPNELEFSIKEK